MERPWEVVRKWSQRVWDAVERGEMGWSDDQHIQNLRNSIAITGVNKAPAASSTTGAGRAEVICRMFNSRGGCRNKSRDTSGTCIFVHFVTRSTATALAIMLSDATTRPSSQALPLDCCLVTPHTSGTAPMRFMQQEQHQWRAQFAPKPYQYSQG